MGRVGCCEEFPTLSSLLLSSSTAFDGWKIFATVPLNLVAIIDGKLALHSCWRVSRRAPDLGLGLEVVGPHLREASENDAKGVNGMHRRGRLDRN